LRVLMPGQVVGRGRLMLLLVVAVPACSKTGLNITAA
jgi:hypothetical protein